MLIFGSIKSLTKLRLHASAGWAGETLGQARCGLGWGVCDFVHRCSSNANVLGWKGNFASCFSEALDYHYVPGCWHGGFWKHFSSNLN